MENESDLYPFSLLNSSFSFHSIQKQKKFTKFFSIFSFYTWTFKLIISLWEWFIPKRTKKKNQKILQIISYSSDYVYRNTMYAALMCPRKFPSLFDKNKETIKINTKIHWIQFIELWFSHRTILFKRLIEISLDAIVEACPLSMFIHFPVRPKIQKRTKKQNKKNDE